jgi:hypothetical protein
MKLTVKQKKKLATCSKCEYARQLMGQVTCGTPITGNVIKYNNKEVKLCGCVMALKVIVTDATCPTDKWQ